MEKKRFPKLPERISKLGPLACNLEWSWNTRSRLLFKRLDPDLWRDTQHNPVKLLNEIRPDQLNIAAMAPRVLTYGEAGTHQIPSYWPSCSDGSS